MARTKNVQTGIRQIIKLCDHYGMKCEYKCEPAVQRNIDADNAEIIYSTTRVRHAIDIEVETDK